MPRSAPRPCAHAGCNTLTDRGRCPTHQRVMQARKDTKTAEERHFYSSARWQKIRAAQLRREPLCRECAARGVVKVAKVADHIVPRRLGGTDDPSNLQSLCWTDHQAKRRQERGASPAEDGRRAW